MNVLEIFGWIIGLIVLYFACALGFASMIGKSVKHDEDIADKTYNRI